MMTNLMVFLMVLSIIYLIRYIVEFLIKFFSDEPTTMKLSKVDTTILYFAIAYTITFIIMYPNV